MAKDKKLTKEQLGDKIIALCDEYCRMIKPHERFTITVEPVYGEHAEQIGTISIDVHKQ